MTDFKRLLWEHTPLAFADIALLADTAATMRYTADLLGADVFLDCPTRGGGMIVAAQAGPSSGISLYERSVTGESALRENEPAVFQAYESGLPAREVRALTQERKTVRQDAVPIKNERGEVIGVLICERDISRSVRREEKLEALARTNEALASRLGGGAAPSAAEDAALPALREMHHRVKNSLQMAASMMNLQARRSGSGEVRAALRENVNRVLSIAAIHDILSQNGGKGPVDLKELTGRLLSGVASFAVADGAIALAVRGDALPCSPAVAHDAALAINELVTNAIEHAFPDGRGSITVHLRRGVRYSTVLVEDDGAGFEPTQVSSASLGFQIVRSTVEKLGGRLQLASDAEGTRVSFDFLNEN